MLIALYKGEDIAAGAADKAFIDLHVRIDVQGRIMIIMKRADCFIHPALFVYLQIMGNDIYDFAVAYDDAGSIGKRYRRMDEVGTPYCITVDDQTMEDGTVTIRDRDTMEQVRVPIAELKNYFEDKFRF